MSDCFFCSQHFLQKTDKRPRSLSFPLPSLPPLSPPISHPRVRQQHHFDGFRPTNTEKGESLKREQVERGLRSKRALTLDVCLSSSTRRRRRFASRSTVGTSLNDVTDGGPSKTRLNSDAVDLWVAPLAFFIATFALCGDPAPAPPPPPELPRLKFAAVVPDHLCVWHRYAEPSLTCVLYPRSISPDTPTFRGRTRVCSMHRSSRYNLLQFLDRPLPPRQQLP
jgi:hypothetical protein